MPLYSYKCIKCDCEFDLFNVPMADYKLSKPCPKCKEESNRVFTPCGISIPRKHQACPKEYDTTPGDDGIPFGEVPGDDDYKSKESDKYVIDDPLKPKP